MYRALYRKWRPRFFEDVVGQAPIVTALQNQIRTGHVGHAYLFTGTRGTGKTTCAKIFAKAINCPHPKENGDPCGVCEICSGIDNGSVMDVVEMDAASNNGVDNIRDLRDETAYTPSQCKCKVYIIDEVHMLSPGAFNALLKIMEEPPSHVVFILATTEIHKVPSTILSRCQRYDFRRITPEDISGRVQQVAETEGIQLTPGACDLISRLADGALRDALSILDTCSSTGNMVDEAVVQQMAGVTDKSYLFRISEAVAAQDTASALTQVARLRQDAVDIKRLCEELIAHYRNLMLCSLPDGASLLSGVSPEELNAYQQCKAVSRQDAIRAIRLLGDALEKMGRGTDARIELELALFSLCSAPVAAAPSAPVQSTPAGFQRSAPNPTAWAPAAQPITAPAQAAAPAQAPAAALQTAKPSAPPPAAKPKAPAPPPPAVPGPPMEYPAWPEVIQELAVRNKMLIAYLKDSKAYFDGKYVLIDGGDTFCDYIRADKDAQTLIKDIIEEKTGVRCPIGPYKAKTSTSDQPQRDILSTMDMLKQQGVEVAIENK